MNFLGTLAMALLCQVPFDLHQGLHALFTFSLLPSDSVEVV